ncbi:MAG: epoxyqueuosine reductase QueH [Candidatus Falkowbacteria bacterium]
MENRSSKKPELLLHICCIGCGAYVGKMLDEEYSVSLFFYNPNIYPETEYKKRLEEIERTAKHLSLPLFLGAYGHLSWLESIRGHETDKEKGERCLICYRERLRETARMAEEKKFDLFSTTLTISPHKDAKAISEIGSDLSLKYKVTFLDRDFKKQDGFKRSVALSHELGLYRQNYCGCEFSRR